MEKQPKSGQRGERLWRFLRNVNIVGAVALGGAGIALESAVLQTLGIINAAQAGFFEVVRRHSAKGKDGRAQPVPA